MALDSHNQQAPRLIINHPNVYVTIINKLNVYLTSFEVKEKKRKKEKESLVDEQLEIVSPIRSCAIKKWQGTGLNWLWGVWLGIV